MILLQFRVAFHRRTGRDKVGIYHESFGILADTSDGQVMGTQFTDIDFSFGHHKQPIGGQGVRMAGWNFLRIGVTRAYPVERIHGEDNVPLRDILTGIRFYRIVLH